ncbi:MAG: hypothetical protein ABJN34_10125, partial [Litoreibacter sp.]|uniref:hypothetical protein n=1 Tax=Litoreibacter sp. TaxID=1969459 RepID=UPI003297EB39
MKTPTTAKITRNSISFRLVSSRTDSPALVALAEEAHNESRFRYIQFSAKKVEKIALAALKHYYAAGTGAKPSQSRHRLDLARGHHSGKNTGWQEHHTKDQWGRR